MKKQEKKKINVRSLSLDEIWEYQIELSGHVARYVVENTITVNNINSIKQKWFDNWCDGFINERFRCFFCTSNDYKLGSHVGAPAFETRICRLKDCSKCPGKLVDDSFNCTNVNYHYIDRPVEFFKHILWLNFLRLQKKKEPKKQIMECYCNFCNYNFAEEVTFKAEKPEGRDIFCPRCTVFVTGVKAHPANKAFDNEKISQTIELIGWKNFKKLFSHASDSLRPGPKDDKSINNKQAS